ncbi:topoisomerase DNA-binding C4 zinc finger domain-containing protein, partial [Candidatus Microgenomates bacterium]|nr:topoisomerase DNA-binding C4 zinc finger domain-containing protein [Candidatus Microgenomates bacterium]
RSADTQINRPTDLQSFPTYRFKANGSVVVFDGFLKLYPQALSEQKLPVYSQGEVLEAEKIEGIEHETTPPPRYNEASLIATLEEKGIGRPSTYAPIISTIEERQYVEKSPSTGSGRFAPTTVGVAVNDFLVKNFSDIDDIPFTVRMEDSLDEIAHGKREWKPMMKEFYEPFAKKLEGVKNADRVKIAVEKTNENCPQCGSALVIRVGRFGKFLSCSTFPKCKFTKSFEEETGLLCPLDKGKVILKKTRRGRRFYGCSNYPACKFAAWKLEEIKRPV